MVTKQNNQLTKKNNKVQITFVMPPLENCNCLYLVGKFTDEWNESVYRMQRADDGTWSLVLELESDYQYQYRYRTDQGIWYNDLAVNEYMSTFKGSDNSVMHA